MRGEGKAKEKRERGRERIGGKGGQKRWAKGRKEGKKKGRKGIREGRGGERGQWERRLSQHTELILLSLLPLKCIMELKCNPVTLRSQYPLGLQRFQLQKAWCGAGIWSISVPSKARWPDLIHPGKQTVALVASSSLRMEWKLLVLLAITLNLYKLPRTNLLVLKLVSSCFIYRNG